MIKIDFDLDKRLNDDTIYICDLPLSKLLLMNDSNYPWFIVVPRVKKISEIFQLSEDDQIQLNSEVSKLSQILLDYFDGCKVNTAALGNIVNQLHVHIIIRKETDISWPNPVWGSSPAVHYSKVDLNSVILELQSIIAKIVF
ncbi:MAG: HIT domain-containing protein [Alphaproteobacteria bacterium]|mgnify:FL=1|jgi:diadenosine tetraphosphate (Ap4A) HIT family hydrolase|nr:HIT family protein [Hyphomicrobiales bacterium]|tara:strand:+ start:1384 stop:1809 length:426 start_codon:yes stop_codon:yes gene_type:complete